MKRTPSGPVLIRVVALGALSWSTGCDLDGATDSALDSGSDSAATVDLDGDGYPAGEDCDDSDPSAVPSAEVYGDDIDQDCDGEREGLDAILPSLEGQERLGTAVEIADATGDGVADLWFSISGYGEDQGIYLLTGPLGDDIFVPSEPTWEPYTSNSWPGSDLDAQGDLDGDGVKDLVITSPFADDYQGAVMVIYGPGDEGGDLDEVEDRFLGTSARYYIGDSVSASGDLDGDGQGELLIGSLAAEDTLIAEGALFILGGPIEGTLKEEDVLATVFGGEEYQDFGQSVAHLGDADGDGLGDFVVGGPSEGSAAPTDLAAIGFGPLSGTLTAADLDVQLTAESSSDAGDTVAGGDMNGDGYADTIVGASARSGYGSSSLGTVAVVFGPPTTGALADADLVAFMSSSHGYIGESLAVADVDQDGVLDLFMGSPNAADFDLGLDGLAVLLYGPETGSVEVGPAASGVVFGGRANQELGGALGVGDLNDDGANDLVFGMPRSRVDGPGTGAIGISWGDDW